ncbi:MAG: patatin-like phospholipase family protein [Elusimicrobiota bacterium]
MTKFKVGLALGGGGARGLAHVGVIKTLLKANIPIDVITGTSIGALIGGMYAISLDINQVEEKLCLLEHTPEFIDLHFDFFENEHKFDQNNFYSRTKALLREMLLHYMKARKMGLVTVEKVAKLWPILLPDLPMEKTKIPFAATAMDLVQGQEVMISKGSIYKAIQASSSIPGIMTPINGDNHQLLVDGGTIDSIPVEAARKLGADFIIAVEVQPRLKNSVQLNNGLAVKERSDFLTNFFLAKHSLKGANVVISPNVKNYHWAGFHRLKMCIKKGELKTEEMIPKIKELLSLNNG